MTDTVTVKVKAELESWKKQVRECMDQVDELKRLALAGEDENQSLRESITSYKRLNRELQGKNADLTTECVRMTTALRKAVDALARIKPWIPETSASEGGASAGSENVRAADEVREALDFIAEFTGFVGRNPEL